MRVLPLLALAPALLGGPAMAFELSSTAFPRDGAIPKRHTCDGEDRSPPLAWRDVPPAAKSLALTCTDPDAPSGDFTHWVIYAIPARARGLPEGVPPEPVLPDGSRQGVNDFRKTGYGGPCPPRSASHRYVFRLYALDVDPGLAPRATKPALLKAIEGHTLGTAVVMGRYHRD